MTATKATSQRLEPVGKKIRMGFDEQVERPKLSQRARQHYKHALRCLEECLGDPRCDVTLMLIVTLSASSEMPDVEEGKQCFTVARKKTSPGIFAANLAT